MRHTACSSDARQSSPLCRAKFANVSHFAVSATALAVFWLHDFNKGAVCPEHHQVVQELFGTKRSILFVTSAKLKCSRVIKTEMQ
jgi:hypothetical protein